jgi:hypothetical protein
LNLQSKSGRLLQLWILIMYYIHGAFHQVSENGYINLHERKITVFIKAAETNQGHVTMR